MKNEKRGIEAVRYAEKEGIFFDVDEDFLLKAEGQRLGRPATWDDIENLFEERLGRSYDSTDLSPGKESFNLLLQHYGDQWIYVALEGNDHREEEFVVLSLYRSLLEKNPPYYGGDLLELAYKYNPQLSNTGFAPDANLNLLFHAALRLVEQEKLESIADEDPLPEEESSSYGRRRFIIPPDFDIDLRNLFCGRCRDECDKAYLILHYECALRLQKALAKATRLHKKSLTGKLEEA